MEYPAYLFDFKTIFDIVPYNGKAGGLRRRGSRDKLMERVNAPLTVALLIGGTIMALNSHKVS
jgi:hypothetical protein